MFKNPDLRKNVKSKSVISSVKIPLLMILLLLSITAMSHAQIFYEDEYQITVGGFSGAPGDTVWMPIYFKNTPLAGYTYQVISEISQGVYDTTIVEDSGQLGGCFLRLVFDSVDVDEVELDHSLLTPLVDYGEYTYEIDGDDTLSVDTTSLAFKFRMVGRGLNAITWETNYIIEPDSSYYHIQPKPYPVDEIGANVMTVLWTPLIDTSGWTLPVIEPYATPTVVMEIPFVVSEDAQHNENCLIDLEDSAIRENQFSSVDGLVYILPMLNDGYFVVDTSGGNSQPEIEISPSGNIIISPGQSIPQLTITAIDTVDGDDLCITVDHDLTNTPSFSPSDSVCGTEEVTMTFNWTSTAADQGNTYTVFFYADDDKLNGRVSASVDITVSGGSSENDPPVVATIIPSTYTVEQGEALPTISVSATDPDGDSLSLAAIGLPSGATFVGNPSLSGKGTVSATFNWLPTFTDQGLYTISFQATDSAGATGSQTIYVTVEIPDVDRLFSKSTYGTGTRPTGGIPGAAPVVFPIDLISTRTVYGINFDMTFPASIADLDSIAVTDRTLEYVVYDNIGVYPDSVRVVTFGLNNEPIVDGESTAILNAYFTLDTAAVPGDYFVHFYDAWESVDPDPEIPSLALVVDSGVMQVDILGDVNLDTHIDVADLVNVVGYIVGNYQFAKRNYETANVVNDSLVNVVDLIGILNLVFGWPINSSPSPASQTEEFATVGFAHDDLEAGQMSKLNVYGEFPEDVAGIQFQIDYDPNAVSFQTPELTDAAKDFRLVYKDDWAGHVKVLLYSQQPWDSETLVSAGAADIVQIPMVAHKTIDADDDSKIRISRTYLSNGSAGEIRTEGNSSSLLPTTFTLHQNYPNPFNPTTKIEFDIGSANDAATKHVTLDIFNILGRRVRTLIDDDLASGSHTVTWDATDDHGRGVATGIYLYRLEVESEHQTKKMLLLK